MSGIDAAQRRVAQLEADLRIARVVLRARESERDRRREQDDYDAMMSGALTPEAYDARWGNSRGAR